MSADEFQAVAPDPAEDSERMLDLIAKCFGDYFTFHMNGENLFCYHREEYKGNHARIGLM